MDLQPAHLSHEVIQLQLPTDNVMHLSRQGTCTSLGFLLLELGNRHVHLPAAIHLALRLRLLNTAQQQQQQRLPAGPCLSMRKMQW